jgi:hypothetical protein
MRGAAQAHLLECDDGHFYAVKFRNNPQHHRILVNEWLASSLLAYLRISTPEIAVVNVCRGYLTSHPDVNIQLRNRLLSVEAGQHFGSRYPGNPAQAMVYDFLPDSLLHRINNLDEFLGVLVLDKWTGNADARQAIFWRLRSGRPWSTFGGGHPHGFFAAMIDQGYAFGGPTWKFCDSPLQGLYFRPAVYQSVRSCDDFEPWLQKVVGLPEGQLRNLRSEIPPEWIAVMRLRWMRC